MQKINKTTSAPLAAAFFALSLAIMPFSLKVVGLTLSLNPSMYAVVDVWNQIAGSFGSGYQPATSAELIAISNLDSNKASDATMDAANGISLLAKLEQIEPEQNYQPQFSAIEAENLDASAPQVKSVKVASPRCHTVKRVGADSYYREIQARISQHAEELKAAETAQRALAARSEQLKGLDKHLAAVRFDIGKMLKSFTFNKDVRVFVKVKPVKPMAAPKLTACDLRTALTGEKSAEIRQSESQAHEAESFTTSFDNCEL
jgi:hypothetical protein